MKPKMARLKDRLNEAYLVEPNDLGMPLLNHWYRRINRYFKRAPFIVVVPATLLSAVLLYLLFGYVIVRLTSLLQYGF